MRNTGIAIQGKNAGLGMRNAGIAIQGKNAVLGMRNQGIANCNTSLVFTLKVKNAVLGMRKNLELSQAFESRTVLGVRKNFKLSQGWRYPALESRTNPTRDPVCWVCSLHASRYRLGG